MSDTRERCAPRLLGRCEVQMFSRVHEPTAKGADGPTLPHTGPQQAELEARIHPQLATMGGNSGPRARTHNSQNTHNQKSARCKASAAAA